MNITRAIQFTMTTIGVLLSGVVIAGPSKDTISVPSGFVSTCGGMSDGNGTLPGDNIATHFSGAAVCSSQNFIAGGSGSSDAPYSSSAGPTGDAKGSASFGVIKLSATQQGTSDGHFYDAIATGGWSDRLTIVDAAHTGQSAIATFVLNVDGTLNSAGVAGFGKFELFPFVNGALSGPGDTFAHTFQVQSNASPSNLTVHMTLLSTFSFTFGTPFKYDVYGLADAGKAEGNAEAMSSSATANFANTVTWGGVQQVVIGNTPIVGFSITSASGVDWSKPSPVPLPAALWLFGSSLGGILGLVRRRITG